jgi:prefoldin subunit 5
VAFFLSSEHWGIHSLTPFHETHTEQIEVATIRLDTALDVDEYIDPVFLKIDAEGADFSALRSWDFTTHRPRVALVEFMDARSRPAYGYGYEDVVNFMTARGYAAYVCEWTPIREYSRRGVELADTPDFVGVFEPPLLHTPDWGNLLFVDRGRDEQFETALVTYLSDVAVHSGRLLRAAARQAHEAEHLSASLSHREARLLTLNEAIRQRDSRIRELDAAVQQRDRRIQELDAAVQQRDRRIQELDAAVQQRDRRIRELDAANAKLDQRLSDVNLTLNTMEDQMKHLNRSIMNRVWKALSRNRQGS